MAVKKLTQEAFNRFVDTLIGSQKVIGVQAKGEAFDYRTPESSIVPSLEPLRERGTSHPANANSRESRIESRALNSP